MVEGFGFVVVGVLLRLEGPPAGRGRFVAEGPRSVGILLEGRALLLWLEPLLWWAWALLLLLLVLGGMALLLHLCILILSHWRLMHLRWALL